MGILKKNITAQRLSLLPQTGEVIFHVGDLANIWSIRDPHLLRVTLMRLSKNGILHRIIRGLYSLIPPGKLDPLLLAFKTLHRTCYVSTETVLFEHGYISQKPYAYTFVSDKSMKTSVAGCAIRSRQLAPQFLHNPLGISHEKAIPQAIPERAICDILYFDPHYHFDREPDWNIIQKMQAEITYPPTPKRYDSSSSQRRDS